MTVNERKAKVKRPRMQLNFLRHTQRLPAAMPVFVALPAKLAKPWKIHDDIE